jgi:hypothetical protein
MTNWFEMLLSGFLIGCGLGLAIGTIAILIVKIRRAKQKTTSTKCPHGNDWDYCPDCSH